MGGLEFKASTKELKDELDKVFHEIHVEGVVIPRTDGRSRGCAFVTLSWAKASNINLFHICKLLSKKFFVHLLPIDLRERRQQGWHSMIG